MASANIEPNKPPLLVILGETASGKSALAMELAKIFDGEIIAADSRTIYRGMDIGTAKPSRADRIQIRHYGLDVVDPEQPFTAADFKLLADSAINEVAVHGKLPIMVGGSGLYIDAVLYDFHFRPVADPLIRKNLQGLSIAQLQERVLSAGIKLPQNNKNPRHLIRLIESGEAPRQPKQLRPNTLVLGLTQPKDILRQRVASRVEAMIDAGLVQEVRSLIARYGNNIEALRAPGYKALTAYLDGEMDLDEAKRQFIHADLQLAKRQRTWFRRNKSIQWLSPENALEEAEYLIRGFLNT